MIKSYNQYIKESLLDKMEGPTHEEIIDNLSKNPDKLLIYSCREGLLDYVKLALKLGARIDIHSNSPLMGAVDNGHLDIVKYLVERGVNIKSNENYAIRIAAGNGHLDIVKYLVEQGANPRSKGKQSMNNAITNGHLDVVKYLVECGIDVSREREFLYTAARYGHLDIVKYLVEQGANFYNRNVLYGAEQGKHYNIYNYLQGKIKENIRKDFIAGEFGKYDMGLSDFRKYCSENNIEYLTDEEIMLYRLNYSYIHGDLEIKLNDVFKTAIKNDYKQVINYFLTNPKELKEVNLDEILQTAIYKDCKEVIYYLLNNPKDLDNKEKLYYYFISEGDLETVKKLVDAGKIKIKNDEYIISLRLLLYRYLVNRQIDMFLYMFGFYKKYTRWDIEWLYDMVNDKSSMKYKNNKEKLEIYKPVIDLLKKTLDGLK